jgi:hypothetical protein
MGVSRPLTQFPAQRVVAPDPRCSAPGCGLAGSPSSRSHTNYGFAMAAVMDSTRTLQVSPTDSGKQRVPSGKNDFQ